MLMQVDASVASNGSVAVPQLASLPASAAGVAERFHGLADPKQRLKLLLEYARSLPALPEAERRPENRVMGCTAQVSRRCIVRGQSCGRSHVLQLCGRSRLLQLCGRSLCTIDDKH